MKSILLEINMLSEGDEKDFLLQSYYNAKRYLSVNDNKSLKMIVSRLDRLYPVMSQSAQEISIMIVKMINNPEEKK